MKKNLLFTLLLSLLLFNCNKENTESTYIPKDAIAVTFVNLETLSKKASQIDLEKLNINKIINDKAPTEISDFLNTNISVEKIANTFEMDYVFGFSSLKRMSGFGGLILPIKSGQAFEKFITPMLEKNPKIQKEDLEDEKLKAYTIYANNNIAIGWNDETALIIFSAKNASDELIKLTKLEKTENVLTTSYFKNFLNSDEDFGIHITSSPIAEVFGPMLSSFTGADLNLSDNSFKYYTSFKKDHIHCTYSLKLNKDIESLLGYKLWLNNDYNKNLLKVLPNNPMALAKLSIDTKTLYSHIESLKNNTVLPKEIRNNIKMGLENIKSESQKNLNLSPKEVFEVFEGSIIVEATEENKIKDSITLYNDNKEPESYNHFIKSIPNFYAAVSIANKENLNKILNLASQNNDFVKESDTHYIIENKVHLVINNDIMLITNDRNNATDFNSNKTITNNLTDFKHKSKFEHPGFIYSNNNLSNLTNYFQNLTPYNSYRTGYNMNDMESKIQNAYQKYFSESYYYFDSNLSESFIYTKGGTNSLEQIILYIDEMAQSFAEMN